jgi:hypothetical protein
VARPFGTTRTGMDANATELSAPRRSTSSQWLTLNVLETKLGVASAGRRIANGIAEPSGTSGRESDSSYATPRAAPCPLAVS